MPLILATASVVSVVKVLTKYGHGAPPRWGKWHGDVRGALT